MKLHGVAYVLVGAVIEPTGCTPCCEYLFTCLCMVRCTFSSSNLVISMNLTPLYVAGL